MTKEEKSLRDDLLRLRWTYDPEAEARLAQALGSPAYVAAWKEFARRYPNPEYRVRKAA